MPPAGKTRLQILKINYLSGPFKRFYDEKWIREYFITSRDVRDDIPFYTLKDYLNDLISGSSGRQLQ